MKPRQSTSLPAIREDEWLAALGESLPSTEARGWTTEELATRLNVSFSSIRLAMRRKILSGAWKYIGKRITQTVDGRRSYTPEFLPAQKKPAKR